MYQEWIKKGLEKGITDLEIHAVESKSLKLSLYEGKIDQHVKSDILAASIKGIYNDKMSTVSFENLNNDNIDYMLEELISNAKVVTVDEPAIIYEGSKKYPVIKENTFDFDTISINEKIQLLKTLESKIKENKYVKQVQNTVYVESAVKKVIINSKGLNLTSKNSVAYSYAVGVFEKDNDIQTAYKMTLAKTFSDFDAEKQAFETIQRGVKKVGGVPLETGSYPVVFSTETFAEMIESFSGIFNGEAAYRNLTALKDKEKQKIASEKITLIDDPLTENAYFQYTFDDEGVACKTKNIIKDGVFEGFIHNLKTAKIFNVEPTGNGFSGGTSLSNCYLVPGMRSFDEMISSIDNGLYVTDLVGSHAGIQEISGEFSLQASGFRIENGQVTTPVKMIVISGNFFKMINEVEEIANDLEFQLSGFGSPSVYIKQLMVGGK
ncbi:predicted peptidase U62, modulator of DNA gyrase [Alteracholeplasma palmae J233]|uniref:Predicted peptidase U62, modulator of DNA gyrase n=1 Tax=Alteracholeplasma palmae (strain ATCC 49389 / J233) TaxID=1318466 RepID=U4KKA7_ALTPJ|nr:metallopeptidase TldD-related protein [Alteracholeplasma palmae]CCV64134.1 predicted peptidase U62, modulator of DNA gyrase [Alteracholeplasma palmae J233]